MRSSLLQSVTSVLALGVVLGMGYFATDEIVTARKRAAAAAAPRPSADELYAGSILYMPDDGRLCHQFLFDNRGGRFRDAGVVDCAGAAYQGSDSTPKQWSSDRMRVISSGFRKG